MPYASQDEIATAVQSTVQSCLDGELHPEYVSTYLLYLILTPCSDIVEDDIDGALLTSITGSPPLDILVRTSGVRRLSNFFLWQVGSIQFTGSTHLAQEPTSSL
jgi:ditrans,polycis-polyprenyl diphosphate synthase